MTEFREILCTFVNRLSLGDYFCSFLSVYGESRIGTIMNFSHRANDFILYTYND